MHSTHSTIEYVKIMREKGRGSAFAERPDVARVAHREAARSRRVEPRELGVASTRRLERQPADDRLVEEHTASEHSTERSRSADQNSEGHFICFGSIH